MIEQSIKYAYPNDSGVPYLTPSSPSLDRVYKMTINEHTWLAELQIQNEHYDIRSEFLNHLDRVSDKYKFIELLKKHVPYNYEDNDYVKSLRDAAKLFSSFETRSHLSLFDQACEVLITDEISNQTRVLILQRINRQFPSELTLKNLLETLPQTYYTQGESGLEIYLRQQVFALSNEQDEIDFSPIPITSIKERLVAIYTLINSSKN